ncbi:hypothetical protein ACOME3_007646 [Neoechinorhynchus agilis]
MSLTSWTTSTMAFFSFAISIASLVMFSKHKDIDGGLCAVYLGNISNENPNQQFAQAWLDCACMCLVICIAKIIGAKTLNAG